MVSIMEEKVYFTIDDLYRTLKKHDKDIQNHFNDDNLDDKTYFYYAINSDIITNALNIVINLKINNKLSVGIDNSARVIIEGMVLLKMLGSDKIDDVQLEMFRKHYAVVDYENFKHLFGDDINHPAFTEFKERYDEAIQTIMNYFNCDRKTLNNRKIFIGDPAFYCKKYLKQKISYTRLLIENPIYDESNIRAYEFFSILIHPFYVNNRKVKDAILSHREKYINVILEYVINYLADNKLLLLDRTITNFEEDFTNNIKLVNNVANLNVFIKNFEFIKNELFCFNEGNDEYGMYFIECVKNLFADIFVCESLGYNELIISKLKPFLESYSMFASINSIENIDAYNYMKYAFSISSSLQIESHINKILNVEEKTNHPELEELYEIYYKKEFDLNDYDEFKNNFKTNSLYFIEPNQRKNYDSLVKNTLEKIFTGYDEKLKMQLFDLYNLSKDMNHASGYNFNSSPGISEYNSHLAMYCIYKIILDFLLQSIVLKTNLGYIIDGKTKTAEMIEMLKKVIVEEKNAMNNIANKYQSKYN